VPPQVIPPYDDNGDALDDGVDDDASIDEYDDNAVAAGLPGIAAGLPYAGHPGASAQLAALKKAMVLSLLHTHNNLNQYH
jgi:hypothetical protein